MVDDSRQIPLVDSLRQELVIARAEAKAYGLLNAALRRENAELRSELGKCEADAMKWRVLARKGRKRGESDV